MTKFQIERNKLVFVAIFIAFGFVALQLPVNQLAGSKVKFTLFDLFAPTSGVFMGSIVGIISVFLMQVLNIALHGFSSIDKGTIIRLFPTLFAVWYFSRKQRELLIIPILAILAFNLHPIGRTVWYYSLFWLIPIVVWPFRERFLVLRSLGATFTAHSVGGAIWIWAFNLPSAVWISLIPVVIMERAIFALGISASYIFTNNLLAYVKKQKLLTSGFSLDKKYLLKNLK